MARFISTRLNINHIRSLNSKSIPNEVRSRLDDDQTDELLNAEYSGGSIRYKVCTDSQVSRQKFVFEKKPVILYRENTSVKSSPSHEGEDNQCSEVPTCDEKGYKSFDLSTTQKNVVLPLNTSKLSSPFPDPVKDFISDALSLNIQPTKT
nr:unnamed protein product [Callosobruchus chinensis]